MGHEITARQNGIEVAYNRRSARNPLNQVLYLALGVFDEAYAGCSGGGCTLQIPLKQFRVAKEVLDIKSFSNMTREPNLADHLFFDHLFFDDLFLGSGLGLGLQVNEYDDDVTQEVEFVEKCICHLVAQNECELTVYFG